MTVGGFVACFIAGPLSDRVGRSMVCSLGAALVIGAALLQTFSTNFGKFVGGMTTLGLGVNFQLLTAPVLVTELAHPMNRVFITSCYNTNNFIGLILGGWVTSVTYRMESKWPWMLPCILQICIPLYQYIMVWFCPGSQRWLVTKGKVAEARKILMHYHSTQNAFDDGIVQTELQGIIARVQADQAQIKLNKAGMKSTIMSKGNCHRIWLCSWAVVGSQCGGGTFIASYLPQILILKGISSYNYYII
ncbi:hypothetical protein NM208_g11771 [Fusarium decemcellulare]|uniref:Uncharacterized protein n=2 Tax=Fusarium decemcellulare TaxID=57161 RepID=A0ACC1RH98_9HYPO|nr:hypothetical protein NM208_g14123 [Fusarium decemcellulare]KAJ3525135.1 hypothetical protein NM208_g11771 [Fusarium decemcellulare]